MKKQEFLNRLREGLSPLPGRDARRILDDYSEGIDDRMEEGMSEERAVRAMGSPDRILEGILSEGGFSPPKKRSGNGQILLLILGSPLWLALLIALAAILIAVVAVLWSVVAAILATALALMVSGVAVLLAIPLLLIQQVGSAVLLWLGAGLLCGGLSIPFFLLGIATAKLTVRFICGTAKGLRRQPTERR